MRRADRRGTRAAAPPAIIATSSWPAPSPARTGTGSRTSCSTRPRSPRVSRSSGSTATSPRTTSPAAGFVRPERCVGAQLTVADRLGAEVRRDERVLAVEPRGGRSSASAPTATCTMRDASSSRSARGCDDFIGPERLGLFTVYRQVLTWFELAPEARSTTPRAPCRCSSGASATATRSTGFPAIDGDARDQGRDRAARHRRRGPTRRRSTSTPPSRVRSTTAARRAPPGAHRAVPARGRAACTRSRRTRTSSSTITPTCPASLLVSPCSGHGFKHSAGLGEAIAQRVTTGTSDVGSLAVPARSFRGRAVANGRRSWRRGSR